MKRILMIAALLCPVILGAQDRTLRLDYIFSGTDKTQEIALDEMAVHDGWAGRRVNMDTLLLRGNGQICMSEAASGKVLYKQSFSTLFQEWQTTEEATRVRKSFENVFLLPMPEQEVWIDVKLYGFKGDVSAEFRHKVRPDDILIRNLDNVAAPEYKYIHQAGTVEDCIDVAIVAEGYTAAEKQLFYDDAQAAVESFFHHEPFASNKAKINFVAVALESEESGVSVPGKGLWKRTALSSNFDTFYSDRYLTTLRMKKMHDALTGVPFEHIIILANTDTYGGGGIYNLYMLTTAHHPGFKPVVVHEFGHSFAGLADEYYYDDMFVQYYYPGVEPWEPNVTTQTDFASKWQDLVKAGKAGLYEGGGYQSKGVWRGAEDCRMKTNEAPAFCPVCERAIQRMIDYHTIPLQ